MILLKSGWKNFLLGTEDWGFLPEVAFRTFFMFAVILFGLSILGKRGVKQLSVFELVVIIGLGSAAGDPMFYKDVGMLPALIVFTIVIGLYIFVTHLVGRNKKVENLVEGKPVYLIIDGEFAIGNFSKEPLGQDEFFAELRIYGISHLGQVDKAIIETNGSVSVFYYEDRDVRYGLPILPGCLDEQITTIKERGHYACVFCGHSEQIKAVDSHHCPKCKKDKWVKASNKPRVR